MPPGGDQVGSAYVEIHVDSSAGQAELDKLMAKADRDFAELGRKKAEASFDINVAKFDAKIDKVKGEIADLEAKKARVSVSLKGDLEKEIAEAKAELKQLGRERVTVKVDAKQIKAANKEQRLLSDARALDEKQALGQAKAEQKLSQERSRSIVSSAKQRAELAKLGDEYERLRGKQKAVEKQSGRIFSPKSVGTAESERRALERVTAEAEHVKAKIESLGGSVEGLDARMGKNTSLLDRWLSRLGDTSVRIGPITTSIKGLATGLGLLGPLIFELGGGAADLIGFLGSGIAGAAAVGGAGLAGFATSAVGVGLVIKPMVKEFGEVKKATEAVAKAELKYGKDSEQVKTAQEQLNHELKGVSPIAKAAIQDYGKLGGEWQKMTAGAKPAVFNAFGQGLKTVQALLPEFARESVATTKVAASAWTAWMKSLRSSDARNVLGEIMSNFRASIPDIAAGLGDLAAMFGHIAAAASHFLPGLSHGFADWASNLEDSVGSGKSLQKTIGGMVHNMQDFGHLAQDSGSFLVHFFGAAAGAGDQLNNSLDHTIESWDKWAQSRKGEESLEKFFTESAGATEDFFSVLGGAVKLLFEFSRATAPIANGLLHIVTFIGNLVSAADKLVGVRAVLQGVGYALASLYVGNKIAAVVSTIGGLAAKLGLIAGPEAAATASITANTAALEVNTAAMAENAAASEGAGAAKGLGALETGAADAAVALDSAGTSAAGFSALLAPEVLVPVAAVGALVYFSTQVANNKSKFEEAAEAYEAASRKMRHNTSEIISSANAYNSDVVKQTGLEGQAKKARENLIKVQEKHGVSSKQFAAANKELMAIEAQQVAAARTSGVQRTQSLHQAEKSVTVAKEQIKAAREERQAANEKEQGSAGNPTEIFSDPERAEHLAEAAKKEAEGLREAAKASRELNIAQIPMERQKQHLHALDTETINGLRQLQPLIGKAATTKIGNFVDPNSVSQITKLSNKLKSVGQGPAVKKIDVKSQGADQTLAKLQRLNKQTGKVTTARVKIEGNDTNANNSLKRVTQMAQRLAGSKPVLRILGDSTNAQDAINKLSHLARGVISKEYKAEIKAADKTGPGFNTAKQHLRDAANTKAEAKIKALDQTKAAIGSAKGGLKGVSGGKYEAKITAINQTQAGIAEAEGALDAIASHTVEIPIYGVYRGTKGSPPSAGGGAAGGVFGYAVGGRPDPDLMQRAAERAEKQAVKDSTYGARISKPTFLTGEEGATHPEYVIATNPAYRTSNERYLEQAAQTLGKEVIPAFKNGGSNGNNNNNKGNNNNNNKGNNNKGNNNNKSSGVANRAEEDHYKDPGEPPSLKAWNHHNQLPTRVNHGTGIKQYTELERAISNIEGKYQAELNKEEREVQIYKNSHGAKGRSSWDFAKFKGWRNEMVADEKKIKEKAIPQEIKDVSKVKREAERTWANAHGGKENAKGHLGEAKRFLSKEESIYKHMRQGKNESSKEYNNKKVKYRTEIDKTKAEIKKWEDRAEAFEAKEKAAHALETEAKEELETLKGEALPSSSNGLSEQENSLAELNAMESGELETPYYEAPEEPEPPKTEKEILEEVQQQRHEQVMEPKELALLEAENRGEKGEALVPYKKEILKGAEEEFAYAKTTPGLQDDIAAAGEIRSAAQSLEESAGGGSGGAPTAAEQTATVNAARQQLYEQFASNLTSAGAGPPSGTSPMFQGGGSPVYAGSLGGLAPVTPGSTSGAAPGTVNNVTNNFAAPPPDPHTFTKNLEFELNA